MHTPEKCDGGEDWDNKVPWLLGINYILWDSNGS